MAHRSYGQYCTLAHALDLVGDRWSLLILRDLILGPKRSVDLLRLLPGIGSNILYDRLRHLEDSNVIRRRVTPPPTPATLYELTDYGRQLEAPISALSQWGAQTLGAPDDQHLIRAESIMLNVRSLFRDHLSTRPPGTVAVTVEDERFNGTFTVRSDNDTVDIQRGTAAHADVSLLTDVETITVLGQGLLTIEDALRSGKLTATGLATGTFTSSTAGA